MPELNGFELFEQIRKLDSKIKVCLISSFQVYYQAMREEHPTLDVRCFIKKPITRNDLVNHVRLELNISDHSNEYQAYFLVSLFLEFVLESSLHLARQNFL